MPLSQLDDRNQKAGPQINPARVVDRMLRYWYFFVITLSIAGAAAWAVNRYTTRIYPISASIINRELEDNAGVRFLYSNALNTPVRNYKNEFLIMRSIPLLQKVVTSLGFEVSYFMVGEI